MPTVNFGAEGHVVARRLKHDGTEIQRLSFNNCFLLSGMDYLLEQGVNISYNGDSGHFIHKLGRLFLGTGTTEPKPDDTGLENRSGTLPAKSCEQLGEGAFNFTRRAKGDTDNHIYWTEADYIFKYGEGEAEGVWTELGLSGDNNYAAPLTRALFRDENGNATSITILSDEFLEVTYTVRFYSGIGAPVADSFTLNGDTLGFSVYPVAGGSTTGWRATTTSTFQGRHSAMGLWSYFFPFCFMHAFSPLQDYPVEGSWYIGSSIGPYSSGTYDASQKKVTHTITAGPSSEDYTIEGFGSTSPYYWDSGSSNRGIYAVKLDQPFTKKANYRVTFTIEVTFVVQLGPVTGVALDAADTSSLTFSWDAYPDATQYNLTLRQAGAVINTQTIAAPTTTATFSGLTASTDYDLTISADTNSGHSTVREVVAGGTTA